MFWTYRDSQKIVNLRRDDRHSCLVEDGPSYSTLRGVELRGRAVIVDDLEQTLCIGALVGRKYRMPDDHEALYSAGRKRVGVRIHVARVASWDHRKMHT